VDLNRDGTVMLNGQPLDEPYISEYSIGECTIELPLQVPDKQFFVMGDHRLTSLDSRSLEIGLIHQDQVIGKDLLRIWPFDKIGFVK